MRFKVVIDTNNAAFSPDAGAEVSRILRDLVADRVWFNGIQPGETFRVFDINGNPCGRVTVETVRISRDRVRIRGNANEDPDRD